MIASLEDRQKYWRWVYARHCFHQVVRFCKASAQGSQGPVMNAALTCAILVTYARPFTKWNGIAFVLGREIIPLEFQKLHEALVAMRHKHLAHFDAKDFASDDPTYGNINQIRVQYKEGTYKPMPLFMEEVPPDVLDDTLRLATVLTDKADYYLAEFGENHLREQEVPDGEYVLNVDSKDSRMLIPVPEEHRIKWSPQPAEMRDPSGE
jgi:hypothetical protein